VLRFQWIRGCRRRALGVTTCLVLGAVIAGCGGGLVTVSGVVTLDGKPLPMARLTLVDPANPSPDAYAVATTDAEGRFSFGPIGKPGGGVKAGPHRLSMTTAFLESGPDDAVVPQERVPPPYSTGVDYDVPSGGTSSAAFELTATKP